MHVFAYHIGHEVDDILLSVRGRQLTDLTVSPEQVSHIPHKTEAALTGQLRLMDGQSLEVSTRPPDPEANAQQ